MRAKLLFNGFTVSDVHTCGGVTLTQTVNSGTDLNYGCTSMSEASFSFRNDLLTDGNVSVGQQFTLMLSQTENEPVYESFGEFTVAKTVSSRNITAVTAYDSMAKFGRPADVWLDTLAYPLTLYSLLSSLCAECGVALGSPSIVNGSLAVNGNFGTTGITARNVLGHIAEASASFALFGTDGKLYLRQYTESGVNLTNADYTKLSIADYSVEAVDSVQIRSTDDDIGVTAGSGNNPWIIRNNPILSSGSAETASASASALLACAAPLVYTPSTVELFSDRGINAGDIITVNGIKTVVMTKKMKASGVTLTSTGDKLRSAETSAFSREIQRLRGKTHELKSTLDELSSTIASSGGDLSSITQLANSIQTRVTNAEDEISTVKQTANAISTRVTNAEDEISTVKQTANAISTRVTNAEDEISTVKQTANAISTRVTNAEDDISNIQQTANSISTRVTNAEGEISTVKQTANAISMRVDNINLSGYVTFDNLSNSGQTVIDGGNITSGTISADRIASGAITSDKIYKNNSGFIPLESALLFNSDNPVNRSAAGLNSIFFGGKACIALERYSVLDTVLNSIVYLDSLVFYRNTGVDYAKDLAFDASPVVRVYDSGAGYYRHYRLLDERDTVARFG